MNPVSFRDLLYLLGKKYKGLVQKKGFPLLRVKSRCQNLHTVLCWNSKAWASYITALNIS